MARADKWKKEKAPSGLDPYKRGAPQYPDLERVLLSAILRKPSIFGQVEPMLVPSHFGVEFHQHVWLGLSVLHASKEVIDAVSLSSFLISEGVVDRPEGTEDRYITPQVLGLEGVAYTTNFDHIQYAKRIKRMSALRDIQAACLLAIDECFEKDDPEEVRTELIGNILKISTASTDNMVSLAQVDDEFQTRLNEPAEAKKQRVIDTGFRKIDTLIEGINECSITAVLAYQKVGKSTLSMQMVEYEAFTTENASLVFMLEMDRILLYRRLIQQRTGIKLKDIMRGNRQPSTTEARLIQQARAELRARNVHIVDIDCRSVSSIRAYVHQFRAKFPQQRIGWIMIDHWNLLDTTNGRTEVEGQQRNAADINNLVKEVGGRVIIPAQCRKPEHGKENLPPSRHDVRGSSALLDIVDNLITIHRPSQGTGETGALEMVKVFLEAGRDSGGGGKNQVELIYNPNRLAFYDNRPDSYWFIGKAEGGQTSFWAPVGWKDGSQ